MDSIAAGTWGRRRGSDREAGAELTFPLIYCPSVFVQPYENLRGKIEVVRLMGSRMGGGQNTTGSSLFRPWDPFTWDEPRKARRTLEGQL